MSSVIILAGGLGTRISEETRDKPKPMVLIAGKPILWHVMSIYASFGYENFIVAGGYKFEVISDWFSQNDVGWNVRILDTGLNTQTAGRIKKCFETYSLDEALVTYGDGLGNVDLRKLHDFHRADNLIGTVTAVRPPARFGVLESLNGLVTHFAEKSQVDSGWINGGFFVLNQEITNFIHSDDESFEFDVMPRLVAQGQLKAFHHEGFWQPMDTLREKENLENLARQHPKPWLANFH